VLALSSSFDETARTEFFDGLTDRFFVNPSAAGEPPRRELFLRLNAVPGATAWLVRMRQQLSDHQAWAGVERDLAYVLRVLFNRGVLEFRQIDLETPPAILERLIESEAVHAINGWREMARRLEADRRCYAFFHPAWPDEPIIFVEVALTRGIASAMQPILDPDSAVLEPRTCDTAMFYSISNCQPGLRGFSFGNPLLVRAIEQLQTEMPWLRRFATISPIPGFRSWLARSAGSLDVSTGVRAWLEHERTAGAAVPPELEPAVVGLCAHYLLCVKDGGEPADPVARFHLANGARLHRLNASSDLTPAGIRRSAGLTVNYLYKLNELERNAESYGRSREVRAVPGLARLARFATASLFYRSPVPSKVPKDS
jgi:malonyl-CoA decarboxylase